YASISVPALIPENSVRITTSPALGAPTSTSRISIFRGATKYKARALMGDRPRPGLGPDGGRPGPSGATHHLRRAHQGSFPPARQDPGLDEARGFQERQEDFLGQGVPGRRGRPGESRGTDPVPQGLRHEDHATGTQDPNRLPAEPQEIGKMPDDTKTPDL